MKYLMSPFLLLIRIWQKFIAPGLAPRCKYYPSCSHYTYEAIKRYHVVGILLGAWRVLRCNPLSYGGVDYVPATLKIGPFVMGERVNKEERKTSEKKVGEGALK